MRGEDVGMLVRYTCLVRYLEDFMIFDLNISLLTQYRDQVFLSEFASRVLRLRKSIVSSVVVSLSLIKLL
jgi:hypothetical protein